MRIERGVREEFPFQNTDETNGIHWSERKPAYNQLDTYMRYVCGQIVLDYKEYVIGTLQMGK